MDERYENDYENTANQWEETDEGGRVTYRERARTTADFEPRTPRQRVAEREAAGSDGNEVEAPSERRSRRRTYEPAGTREYRSNARPGRTRSTRNAAPRVAATAGGAAEGVLGNYGQLILLAAVALLAVISLIAGVVSCSAGGGAAQEAETTVPMATATQAAANVEAAEKTTDANGIIHGTTEDGTNFTIVKAGDTAAAATAVAAADEVADGSASTSESASTATESASTSESASASESSAATESTAAESESSASEAAAADSSESSSAAATKQKVSFAAVGDQVASDYALELADGYAGSAGDGKYDFKPFYKEVKSFIQQSDLRYINQETPLIGGQENYEVAGYPNFISPEACADAIVDTGFNMVNFTSNHSYDAGTEGIEFSQKVWAKYPQIVIGGSYATQADRETVHMIESNGIRFAFLAYSYGDNTYTDISKEPNNYYAVPFVKDDAAADIARAKKVADCIIVSMHWGDEYTAELNADQKDWAQWLADQDVDLVVGTHAHNIQPVQYFTGTSGNKLPVVFGLGDFVSGWTITDTILSGIFTCDFVLQDNGRVSVENPKWHPTIEWSDGSGDTYVRMLENLTVDQINANTRTEDVPNSFQHVYSTTNSVISQIPVEWGSDADDKAAKGGSDSSDKDSDDTESGSSASASGHVDEDEDGYDDNTDEWIGFGDDEEDSGAASDSDETSDSDDEADSDGVTESGVVDEDGDGYDDNTDEWIGGDEEYTEDEYTEDEYTDEEYTEDEYTDEEYTDEEYTEEEYTDEEYAEEEA